MRTLLCALALAACASGSHRAQPSGPAATAVAGSVPSKPQVAAPGTAAPTAPGPATAPATPATTAQQTGPMTAAEAAAALAARSHVGGPEAAPSEDAPCVSDDDCTFTRVAPGACCPMLCEPRAVTKQGAEAVAARERSCAMFKCPEPTCRPPRQSTSPACVQNRCVSKATGGKGPD